MGQKNSEEEGEIKYDFEETLPLDLVDVFIPDDIFFTIFTFLGGSHLRNAKLCSKRFNYLANLSGNSFIFNGDACKDPKVVKEIVQVVTDETRSKLFRKISLDTLSIKDHDLLRILQSCTNLQDLSIKGCDELNGDRICVNIQEECQRLRVLDIRGVISLTKSGFRMLSQLRLESLSLDCSNDKVKIFFSEGTKGEHLEKLHLEHRNSFFDGLFYDLPREKEGYINMKHLSVHKGGKYKEKDLKSLEGLFPNLTSFSHTYPYDTGYDYYYGRPRVASTGNLYDLQLLQSLPHTKIRHLNLPGLNRENELNFFEPFTCLQSLEISANPFPYLRRKSVPFRFTKLLNSARTMTKLSIKDHDLSYGGNPQKIEEEIKAFVKEFTNITYLKTSFKNVSFRLFVDHVNPYFHSQGPKLRVLDITLPEGMMPGLLDHDFSFIQKLESCRFLGFRGKKELDCVKALVKEMSQAECLRKCVKVVDLSGTKYVTKEMVRRVLVNMRELEEFVVFGSGLNSRDFAGLRKRFRKVKIYIM